MKCLEKGVLNNSDYFFQTPSTLAKNLFFYSICLGEFFCETPYNVMRKNYNSFLIMFITNGECQINFREKTYIAKQNDIVFLNCYEKHSYKTNSYVNFLFIHFDGNVSSEFFEAIYKNHNIIFSITDFLNYKNKLLKFIENCRNNIAIQETKISCFIQELLCELLSNLVESNNQNNNSIISIAIEFIEKNYNKDITLTQIANSVNISNFYFSRIFKKETGYSPYEYLMNYRIQKSKSLLKNTTYKIKEIAFLIGFNSEANFIAMFHKKVGMSPNNFRKLPF